MTQVNNNDNSHYDKGGFKVWDIIASYAPSCFNSNEGYLWGNILKYLLRCGFKHPTPEADLRKAFDYLTRLLEARGIKTVGSLAERHQAFWDTVGPDGSMHEFEVYLAIGEEAWRKHRELGEPAWPTKSNDPAPSAAVEAGTTKEKESGSASTATVEESWEGQSKAQIQERLWVMWLNCRGRREL